MIIRARKIQSYTLIRHIQIQKNIKFLLNEVRNLPWLKYLQIFGSRKNHLTVIDPMICKHFNHDKFLASLSRNLTFTPLRYCRIHRHTFLIYIYFILINCDLCILFAGLLPNKDLID